MTYSDWYQTNMNWSAAAAVIKVIVLVSQGDFSMQSVKNGAKAVQLVI